MTYSECVTTVEDVRRAHGDQAICHDTKELIEFVGRRWLGMVLIAGYVGARRFTEYRRFADGISDRVLTLRLRQLEQRGLVERTVVPSMPVQISYAPTPHGRALVEALQPLFSWGLETARASS